MLGPVHASPLQPGADDHFAAGLDHAAGGAWFLPAEVRGLRARAVVPYVARTFSSFLAGWCMAAFGPLGGAWIGRAVEGLGDGAQVLPGMETVHDVNGSRKQFRCDVPDPGGAVADDRGPARLPEAAPGGLAQHSFGELGAIRRRGGGAPDGGRAGYGPHVAHGHPFGAIARVDAPRPWLRGAEGRIMRRVSAQERLRRATGAPGTHRSGAGERGGHQAGYLARVAPELTSKAGPVRGLQAASPCASPHGSESCGPTRRCREKQTRSPASHRGPEACEIHSAA